MRDVLPTAASPTRQTFVFIRRASSIANRGGVGFESRYLNPCRRVSFLHGKAFSGSDPFAGDATRHPPHPRAGRSRWGRGGVPRAVLPRRNRRGGGRKDSHSSG